MDELIAERLLQIIDEGRRTATYKLALLLALLDRVAIDPEAERIPTRDIAVEVLARYYPQARRYVSRSGIDHELRQISMKQSPALRAVFHLRVRGDASGCRTARDCAERIPDAYERALSDVEITFVRYPIPLLQVVGATIVPFLYEPWPEGTSVHTLRRSGQDHLTLRPGVARELIRLGPLVRPLIELHWARDVATWSGINTEDESLNAHLFGVERTTFPPTLRGMLSELQDGSCFYCGDRLARRVEVDHFIAWSRWPNDAIENLVLADACNGMKSDHLAAAEHVAHWLQHHDRYGSDLADIARNTGWTSDADRSRGLVRSNYVLLPDGSPLWKHGKEFELADARVAALFPQRS